MKIRRPFKKLLDNCKLNGIYQKKDGTWTINSSTNQRRMNKTGNSVGGASGPNQKQWTPAKILITEQDLENQWIKQGQICYWLKIPLDLELLFNDHPEWYTKHPMAPSVDRIDDTKDYTPDNILITSRFANFGRNVFPYDRMVIEMEKIRKHLVEPQEKFL